LSLTLRAIAVAAEFRNLSCVVIFLMACGSGCGRERASKRERDGNEPSFHR